MFFLWTRNKQTAEDKPKAFHFSSIKKLYIKTSYNVRYKIGVLLELKPHP